MLKINLLPSEKGRARSASTGVSNLLVIGVAGSLVLLLGGLFLFHATQQGQVDELKAQNTRTQGEIDAIKSRVADHQKILDELAEIRRREEAIEQLQAARTGPMSMLVEISKVLTPRGTPTADPEEVERLRNRDPSRLWSNAWEPQRLWLTGFEEDNRNVKIGGEGRTNDDVSEFMTRLQLSLFFQNVRLDRTEASTNAETKIPVQKFIITGRVRY
ncbi:MAG: PilN domain-containing protein [Polyangiales bacterium]